MGRCRVPWLFYSYKALYGVVQKKAGRAEVTIHGICYNPTVRNTRMRVKKEAHKNTALSNKKYEKRVDTLCKRCYNTQVSRDKCAHF